MPTLARPRSCSSGRVVRRSLPSATSMGRSSCTTATNFERTRPANPAPRGTALANRACWASPPTGPRRRRSTSHPARQGSIPARDRRLPGDLELSALIRVVRDGRTNGDNSSPTVAAGVVFFGDGAGHRAVAFDARTGRLLWDSGRTITHSIYAGPTVVGGKVYISSVGGTVSAFAPAPRSISPPSISGRAMQGGTVTVTRGSSSNDPTRYSYQWDDCDSSGKNCAAIGGATRQTYMLTSADVGHTIRVEETATNVSGSSSPAVSRGHDRCVAATAVEHHATVDLWEHEPGRTSPSPPEAGPTRRPTSPINGSAAAAQATAARRSQARPRRPTSLTAADVGATIRVEEIASNTHPSPSPAISAPTGVVEPATTPPTRPSNDSPPVISGTTAAGQTLSGSTGAWSGTPPISLSYQWERCAGSCSPIAGATSSSYRLTHTDVGTEVALAVTASNSAGSATATSAQVGPVKTAGPTPRQVKQALLDALKRLGHGEHRAAAQERRGHGRLLGAQPRPAGDRLVPDAEGDPTAAPRERDRDHPQHARTHGQDHPHGPAADFCSSTPAISSSPRQPPSPPLVVLQRTPERRHPQEVTGQPAYRRT